MFKVLVNYNFTPDKEWIGDDYLIYDRSDSKEFLKDFDQSKIIYTENIGQVDRDKLGYLIDNYDNLPDIFLWGKTNLFKYLTPEEYELVKNNTTFTPLLTKNHKVITDAEGKMSFYENGMYYERNNTCLFTIMEWKFCQMYWDFAKLFDLPNPQFIPFPPGGNYILTKEVIHKYDKDFYKIMRNMLGYTKLPLEAHFCERSYFNMWR